MKFALEERNNYHINSYEPGEICINGQAYGHSVIIIPGEAIAAWPPNTLADLKAAHFTDIKTHQPEVLLLGVGETLRFPSPELTAPLAAQKIGVEVMDTRAACRTFNLLIAEGRKVVAALIV